MYIKIALISLLILLANCAKAQNSFEIGMPFTQISLRGAITAELIPADNASATVTVNGIDQKRVDWNVKNGRLNVSVRVGVLDKDASATLKIYYKELSYIGMESAVITSEETLTGERLAIETFGGVNKLNLKINVRNLDITATGDCKIDLSGEAQEAVIKAYMGAKIDCMRCPMERVMATIRQKAELYVKTSGDLDAKVSLAGNLFYLGTPRLNSKATMGGAIISIDPAKVNNESDSEKE